MDIFFTIWNVIFRAKKNEKTVQKSKEEMVRGKGQEEVGNDMKEVEEMVGEEGQEEGGDDVKEMVSGEGQEEGGDDMKESVSQQGQQEGYDDDVKESVSRVTRRNVVMTMEVEMGMAIKKIKDWKKELTLLLT